ncbi:MAG TPA: hypothetical protein VD963_10055, partial [Phycisphaerales bacterium]|nr:hypothetical protein [Phycisphaerales bacterium]
MSQNPPPASPTQPVFDPSAGHQQRPRLRPVRGFPVQAQTPDGQAVQMLGLADARQIASQVVVTAPAAQLVLPKLDGTRDLDQVVQEVGRGLPRQFLEGLVAQLDHAGLLEGPTFQAMLDKVRADFDAAPNLPPAATAAFVDALLGRQESAAPADP